MVDYWAGFLLERVKNLGLWDNKAIVFTTDHGFCHGEHGLIGKSIIASSSISNAFRQASPDLGIL